jgi:hypothetical protein
MSSITCPVCGAPVSLHQLFDRENKPFCTGCGWNVDRAEAALNSRKNMLKFGVLALAAVAFVAVYVARRSHENTIFLLPAAFVLLGSLPLWHYLSARRRIAAVKSLGFPNIAATRSADESTLQLLTSVPRPRRVRVKFAGTLGLTLVLVSLILICVVPLMLSTWHEYPRDSKNSPLLSLFFLIAVVAALVVPYLLCERRNWPLLRDGEVALGRVLSQQTVHQGRITYSQIQFEFRTNSGQLLRNSQKDLTEKVFEDMSIPVFYDALDTSKNIALCATYLRIPDSSNS